MTWVDFKWVFEKEYLFIDILYMKAQELFHLKQGSITVKGFSTKLNSLAKYAQGQPIQAEAS